KLAKVGASSGRIQRERSGRFLEIRFGEIVSELGFPSSGRSKLRSQRNLNDMIHRSLGQEKDILSRTCVCIEGFFTLKR
ncbi:hypothetical protein RJZ57_007306, partial [Blastomyces gilchristii]